MKKIILLILLVILAGYGYTHLQHADMDHDMMNMDNMDMSSMEGMDMSDMDMSNMTPEEMAAMGHNHDELVEITVDVPTIELTVSADPKSGYNAEIRTTNFNFRPENASTDHVDNEGHAHIYVNEVKINRVYGNWYYLGPELFPEPGTYTVRAELSTNDHHTYGFEGAKIDKSISIEVE